MQIKSRKRVMDFGEVFTNDKEINAMLHLVKKEINRIESKILEPAAGNGNFLVRILEEKLKIVNKKFKKNQELYEKTAFLAISNLYGIDILNDNVFECRERLYNCLLKEYTKLFKDNYDENFMNSINYILEKNIVQGDGLSCLNENDEPIIFSEWILENECYVKKEDFVMAKMVGCNDFENDELKKISKNKYIKFEPIYFKEVYKLG